MTDYNWTPDKPTEEGLYYVNSGDVVTRESLSMEEFWFEQGEMSDMNGLRLSDYGSDYKYKKVNLQQLNEE